MSNNKNTRRHVPPTWTPKGFPFLASASPKQVGQPKLPGARDAPGFSLVWGQT